MEAVRCMLLRGGTSKGAYFLEDDLPADPVERRDLLLRIMGSPDARQIDGIGGAHPLTSKVAVVSPSPSAQADVDYLFLQVGTSEPLVTDRQNCGNLLAGVGPFALERGLVEEHGDQASVRIRMLNTDSFATATFPVRHGLPRYDGDTSIAGVPGTSAPIEISFTDLAGGSCGALLPTGSAVDRLGGIDVTCIDNGMPTVLLAASSLGITGYESPRELEDDQDLRTLLERVRLAAGPAMNLGDVAEVTVPKMTIVAAPKSGGAIMTRTFLPHRCHDAIGVLCAVSVATACRVPGSVAEPLAELDEASPLVRLEHPTGTFDATVSATAAPDGTPIVDRAGIIRTARKLMDGTVFPRPV